MKGFWKETKDQRKKGVAVLGFHTIGLHQTLSQQLKSPVKDT